MVPQHPLGILVARKDTDLKTQKAPLLLHPSKKATIPLLLLPFPLFFFLPFPLFFLLLFFRQQLSINSPSDLTSELLLENDGCFFQVQESLPQKECSVILLDDHHTTKDLFVLLSENENRVAQRNR